MASRPFGGHFNNIDFRPFRPLGFMGDLICRHKVTKLESTSWNNFFLFSMRPQSHLEAFCGLQGHQYGLSFFASLHIGSAYETYWEKFDKNSKTSQSRLKIDPSLQHQTMFTCMPNLGLPQPQVWPLEAVKMAYRPYTGRSQIQSPTLTAYRDKNSVQIWLQSFISGYLEALEWPRGHLEAIPTKSIFVASDPSDLGAT